MIGADKGASPIPQHHGYGTSPMSPREPQHTPPKTLAMNSSRDMLEKLRREIDRLAGSIIPSRNCGPWTECSNDCLASDGLGVERNSKLDATPYSHCESPGAD